MRDEFVTDLCALIVNCWAVIDMLLTATAIGSVVKAGASISGAEVGCQGEVGRRVRWRPEHCVEIATE